MRSPRARARREGDRRGPECGPLDQLLQKGGRAFRSLPTVAGTAGRRRNVSAIASP